MTIQIYASVTGATLAREFAQDPEETAYLLTELAECADAKFVDEVAEFAPGNSAALVKFLRATADRIEHHAGCCRR